MPAICTLEIAFGAARGRIVLDRPTGDCLQDALALPRVELLPLTPAVAVKAAELPAGFPGDPADRVIAATAILHSAPAPWQHWLKNGSSQRKFSTSIKSLLP